MNSYIVKQLKQCQVAVIPPFDENTSRLLIKKKDVQGISPARGKCFIVELTDAAFNSPDIQTFHINWNKGRAPQDKYMKCEVEEIVANMIRINGVGYVPATKTDLMSTWEGWLPLNSIRFLEVI